jgi:hypothetical protein
MTMTIPSFILEIFIMHEEKITNESSDRLLRIMLSDIDKH